MGRLQDYYNAYPEKRKHLENLLSNSRRIQNEREKKTKTRLQQLAEMKARYYGESAQQ